MPDETLTTTEESSGDSLFAEGLEDLGEKLEDSGAVQQEEPGEEEKEEEKTEVKEEQEPTYKIKYDKKELELPLSEVLKNAQKGLNYDRVQGRLLELESSPERVLIDALAEQSGLSREEYLDYCKAEVERVRVEKESAKTPDELVKEKIKLEKELARMKQGQKQLEEKSKIDQMFERFVRENPDVKQIPEELKERIKAGEDINVIYKEYENKKLKEELESLRKNMENKKSSTGSALSSVGGKDNIDSFLSGLFS